MYVKCLTKIQLKHKPTNCPIRLNLPNLTYLFNEMDIGKFVLLI